MFDADNISAERYVRDIWLYNASRLASKLFQHHPDTSLPRRRSLACDAFLPTLEGTRDEP